MTMMGMSVRSRDALLQIESTEARKSNVKHQATRSNDSRVGEELLRGLERFSLPPFVADQQFQRFAHRYVVVNHEHDWRGAGLRHQDDLDTLSPGHDSSRLQERHGSLSATLSASRRAVSLKGLIKHCTAPCPSARRRTASSA